MRHGKTKNKLGKTTSHRRAMIANLLKSLVIHGRLETTTAKAKVLKRFADRLITIAKKNDLASRRQAIAKLRVRYNSLTPKEARQAKQGNKESYNDDRKVIDILFQDLGPRFAERKGGYTRLIKGNRRVGDNAERCVIEYLA